MKTMFLAIASMALGTVLGFLVCGATARRLRRNTHSQRTAPKARDAPKKMGVMDKVLVLEGVILVAYTVAALAVFWHTGGEPSTLTACVFGVCGLENGVMGWIKTNKDKQQDRKWAEEDRQRMEREAQQPAQDFEPSFTAEQKNRDQ